MAKVLVVGSRKDYDPKEFRDACRAIGVALARGGHTIVAAGCGDDDAETWVLDGADSLRDSERKTKVIPFAPAVPGTQDLIIETRSIATRWPHLIFLSPFKTKGPWAVGQAVALVRSDVPLLIGGGKLTANVGSLALELDRPYYAVGALGGAAAIIASEDYSKHREIGMPEKLLKPVLGTPEFGSEVVEATEFMLRQTKEKRELRNAIIRLSVSVVLLTGFLVFLFRGDEFGKEPQLLYTTCFGAIIGVFLVFLIGGVIRREKIKASTVIGQVSLALFLGALYGFFAVHAGSFYGAEVAKLHEEQLQSLAKNMGLLGVGVGALLGPASKRALEELGHTAGIKSE